MRRQLISKFLEFLYSKTLKICVLLRHLHVFFDNVLPVSMLATVYNLRHLLMALPDVISTQFCE